MTSTTKSRPIVRTEFIPSNNSLAPASTSPPSANDISVRQSSLLASFATSFSFSSAPSATRPLDLNKSKLTEFGFRATNNGNGINTGGINTQYLSNVPISTTSGAPVGGTLIDRFRSNTTVPLVATANDVKPDKYSQSNQSSSAQSQLSYMDTSMRDRSDSFDLLTSSSNSPSSPAATPVAYPSPYASLTTPNYANSQSSSASSVGRQYWMIDANCSVCYDCGLSFHFWRRRHHCRLCGQIFCQSCSPYTVDGAKYHIQQPSSSSSSSLSLINSSGLAGAVRACKQCYYHDRGEAVGARGGSGGSIAQAALMGTGGGAANGGSGGGDRDSSSGASAAQLIQRHHSRAQSRIESAGYNLTGNSTSQTHQSSSSMGGGTPIGTITEDRHPPATSVYMHIDAPRGSIHSGHMASNHDNIHHHHANDAAAASNATPFTAEEEDEMRIPTATTPSSKYSRRRSRRTTAGSIMPINMEALNADASSSMSSSSSSSSLMSLASRSLINAKAAMAVNTVASALPTSSTSTAVVITPSTSVSSVAKSVLSGGESSSDDSDADGNNSGDSDVYDEEDDYVAEGNHASEGGTSDAILNAHDVSDRSRAASSSSDRFTRSSPPALLSDSALAALSTSEVHSLQLAEQLSEIQMMQLHRARLERVNRSHLTFVVAKLVAAYALEEKWVAIVLDFAARSTHHVAVEPNKRSKQLMAQAQMHALESAAGSTLSPPLPFAADDHMDITPYVKLKSIPGGSTSECRLIDGVMLRKNVAHKKMRASISNPRILLLHCALEYQRIENRLSSLDTVLEQERAYISLQISKILSWTPDIVVVEKSVSRLAQDLFRDAGVTLVLNVKPTIMARLARATYSQPMSPAIDYVDKCASMGTCGKFQVESFQTNSADYEPSESRTSTFTTSTGPLGETKFVQTQTSAQSAAPSRVILMSFEDCAPSFHATILLRGGDQTTLKRVKSVLRQCIHVAYHLTLETALLFDQCATYEDAEMESLQESYRKTMAAMWGEHAMTTNEFKMPLARPLKDPSLASGAAGADASESQPSHLARRSLSNLPAVRPGFGYPVSSSPFVDMSVVPVPGAILEMQRHLGVLSGSGPVPGAEGAMWVHESILFGSTWFSSAGSCFPPEVKRIQFYSDTDKTLGQFLIDHCFDVELRCGNEKCGKDALKHTLAYTHREGRIVISVKRIRKRAQNNSFVAGAASTSSSSSSGSPDERVAERHPLDHPVDLMMWSRCKLCARRVTPYMPMSDPTYKISFGKFLDLSFHQRAASCRTGSCAHKLYEHVRCFSFAGLMATFEFGPFPSYAIITSPNLASPLESVTRSLSLAPLYNANLTRLTLVSYVVFEEFVSRIADMDGTLDLQEHRDVLRRLMKKVCGERDRFTSYLRNIGQMTATRRITTMTTAAAAVATIVAPAPVAAAASVASLASNDADESSSAAQTDANVDDPISPPHMIVNTQSPVPTVAPSLPCSPSAPSSTILFDSMSMNRLERRLLLNFLSWNAKLADFHHVFFPKLSHSQSATVAKSWWSSSSKDKSASEGAPAIVPTPTPTPAPQLIDTDQPIMPIVVTDNHFDASSSNPIASISSNFITPVASMSSSPITPSISSPRSALSSASAAIFSKPPSFDSAESTTSASSAGVATNALLQPSASFAGATPATVATAVSTTAPSGVVPPKLAEKKAEFSFREFFHRVTDSSTARPSNSTPPSVQVTADTLTAHNPALGADAFDSFKSVPHLGLPPSVPPLVIPVNDDQPASIIAYTLASLEHLITVGRIKTADIKTLQAVQTWMAHEEDKIVNTFAAPSMSTYTSDAQSSSSAVSSSPVTGSPSVGRIPSTIRQSRSSIATIGDNPFNNVVPTREVSSSSIENSNVAPPPSSTPSDFESSNRPFHENLSAPPVSSSGGHSALHHSSSEHHISFLYPQSSRAANSPAPTLPPHLSIASLLGFDPARDRADIVESLMTRCLPNEFATTITTNSTSAQSASSTDHANHTFKYQFADVGMQPSMSGAAQADTSESYSRGASGSVSGNSNASNSSSSSSSSSTPSFPPDSVATDRTTFRCTAYFPVQFHALRLVTCGGDYEMIQSLCHSSKWAVTGGKSGSTFLKTTDERFICKFISRTELKMFLQYAAKYFGYIAKNLFHHLPSFLVKVLGAYQISWKKSSILNGKKVSTSSSITHGTSGTHGPDHDVTSMSSQYVLIMPNLFFSHTGKITKIFDLKGSARNRYVKRKNREENRVLLDENLMEYTDGYPLPLSDLSKNILRMSVFNDTLYLSNIEIVDYSIIVGLDPGSHTLVVGIIDYNRQYTWDKKFEMGVKSVGIIAGQNIPTIISPQNYKTRFRLAMDRYFMSSPTHSSVDPHNVVPANNAAVGNK